MFAMGLVSSRKLVRSVVLLGVLFAGLTAAAFADSSSTVLKFTTGGPGGTPVTSDVVPGTIVTLTATVISGGNPVTPGTVIFCDHTFSGGSPFCAGGIYLGTAQLNGSGKASISTVFGQGAHSVWATFVGTNSFDPSDDENGFITVSGIFPTQTNFIYAGQGGSYAVQSTVEAFTPHINGPPDGSISFTNVASSDVLGTANMTDGATAYHYTLNNLQTYNLAFGPSSVATADFNGDGILDLAVATSKEVDVMLGAGDGTFLSPTDVFDQSDLQLTAITVGDFDNNGTPDIAVTDAGADRFFLLLGTGDGTFSGTGDSSLDPSPNSVYAIDINRDGNLDIISTTPGNNTISIRLGNGDGSFQDYYTISTGNGPNSLALGDFDQSGTIDMVVVNGGDSTITMMHGDGGGSFTNGLTVSTGNAPIGIVAGDFGGGRGYPDFAIANSGDNTISLYSGRGTFDGFSDGGPDETIHLPVSPTAIATGDFDVDGKADLAVTNSNGSISILLGSGNLAFQSPLQTVTGNLPNSLVSGDFNGDAIPDFAVTQAGDASVSSFQVTSSYKTIHNLDLTVNANETIRDSYSGGSQYDPSQSSDVMLSSSQQLTTTLALATSQPSAPYGTSLTFTATLDPSSLGSHTTDPQGVAFYDGTNLIGAGALSSGVATLTLADLAAGTHDISAVYGGDTYFAGATSDTLTQEVTTATSTTTIFVIDGTFTPQTSNPLGTRVILFAHAQLGSLAANAGTVTFCDLAINTHCTDAAFLGTAQVTSSGNAYLIARLPLGAHSLQATYAGIPGATGSTSSSYAYTVTGLSPTITRLTPFGTNDGSNANFFLESTVLGTPYGSSVPALTGSVDFIDTSNSNAVLGHVDLSGATSAASPLLTAQTPVALASGAGPSGVVLADINSDGYPDIITANTFGGTVSVAKGNPDGTFQAPDVYSSMTTDPSNEPQTVVVGDFNGDGSPDIATGSFSYGTVSVLLNDGSASGTFSGTPSIDSPAGFELSQLTVADVNHDGILDLLATDPAFGSVEVLLGHDDGTGHGDGTFGDTFSLPLPSGTYTTATGDFTGDGNIDLVAFRASGSRFSLYKGNADGTFNTSPINTSTSFQYGGAVGDFDGDGHLDIATESTIASTISIFFGDGTGHFTVSPTTYDTGSISRTLIAKDINADGKTDLAIVSFNDNKLSVLLNAGTGSTTNTFGTPQSFPAGDGAIALDAADLNGDGRPDIVVANSYADSVSEYLYTSGTLFTLPGTHITFSDSDPHQVIARYSGDTNYNTSDSTAVDLTTTYSVPTTLSIHGDKTFVDINGNVTYTATLSPSTFEGVSTDGESVFFIGGFASGPVGGTLHGGVATVTVPATELTTGLNTVFAVYPPTQNPYLAPNTSANTITYLVDPTTTAINVSVPGDPHPIPAGSAVILTANVVQGSNGVDHGTVSFCDTSINAGCTGSAIVATAQLSVGGTAIVKYIPQVGTHTVKAIFTGNQFGNSSESSAASFTIAGTKPTSLGLLFGGTVGNYTLTANLGSNSILGLVPTGSISILDNAVPLASSSLSSATSVRTLAFTPTSTSPATDSGPLMMASGDFNGDGIPDLVTSNSDNNSGAGQTLSVLQGNGDGTFAAQQSITVDATPTGVVTDDFNGDGNLDIALTSYDFGSINVLLGNGDGTFSSPIVSSGISSAYALVAGDFNGDGTLDLAFSVVPLVSTGGGDSILVALGHNDGIFDSPVQTPIGHQPHGLAAADLNGDGILDLVVANTQDNTASILIGVGDGTMNMPTTIPTGSSPYSVAISDLDGDGKLDLAILNGDDSGSVSVRKGNGDGTFQSESVYPIGNTPSVLIAADLDGDGKMDLAATNSCGCTNTVSVLIGNGDATFQSPQALPTGTGPYTIVAADFDHDGRMDLAASNDYDNTVSVLMNQSSLTQTITFNSFNVPGSGHHDVSASYPGDTHYDAANSSNITLDAAQVVTSLTLGSSLTPSVVGGSVRLTATLTPSSSGGYGTDGGTVSFYLGSDPTPIGTGTLSGGIATFDTSSLPVGANSISAVYGGNTNFAGATSSSFIQTVQFSTSIWVANGNGTLSFFNNAGVANGAAITGGGRDVAFDASGNVWSINNIDGNSLIKLDPAGSIVSSSLSGGGLANGQSLAIDGNGTVWTVSSSNNRMSAFNSTGTAISPADGYKGGTPDVVLNIPSGIAIDNSGNIWVANHNGSSVTEYIGAAAPVVTPLATAVQNNVLGTKP